MMDNSLTHFHQRALMAIGTALHKHNDINVWLDLENILRARLTPYERACLLTSVVAANDTDLLLHVLETLVPERLFGTPLPVAFEIEDDARWWAERATLPERKAWATACFLRLPKRDRTSFLAAAKRRYAA